MCGGGGGSYTAPKIDPVPTVVNSTVDNGDRSATNAQRRKRGASNNAVSTDRDTILGNMGGLRNTLG